MAATSTRGRRPGRLAVVIEGLPAPFWWLWSGTLVNRLGMVVQPFLVLYLTTARGLSPASAGLIVALCGVGALLSHPLGGVLTDLIGRRRTMAIGLLANGAALLALGAVQSLAAIAVCALLVGVVGDIFRPASAALIADLVDPADRPRAYSLQYWAVNLGFSVATLTAGLLVSHGYSVLFYVDAGTAAIFAGLVLRGIPNAPAVKGSVEVTAVAREPRGGLRLVLADRLLLKLVGVSTLTGVVYMQAYTTLPLAVRASGLPASAYGIALAVNGAAIVFIQPLVVGALVRRDRGLVLAVSQLIVCLGMASAALCSTTLQYAGSVLLWTIGEIGVGGLFTSLIADLAPASLRGRYLGVFGVTYALAAAAGPALGTAVYQLLGANVLWTLCVLAGVLATSAQLAVNPAVQARVRLLATRE